jgi:SAM-dependent methyltransferase
VTGTDPDDWVETNRAWWDERAATHEGSRFYDLDRFVEHPDRLRPYEVEELGDVAGLSLVHLQCHLGTDTLSWATRGARVVGLDFSGPAIDAARRVTSRLGYDDGRAEFVCSDVYDAVDALGGRAFDVVYTGLGALNWLDDLDRWAAVVDALLRPGGRLYVVEFHPFTGVFDDEDLSLVWDYWDRGRYPADGSYADLDASFEHNESVERNATIGEVVTAVASRGLVIRALREHDTTVYARWPWLVKEGFDTYRQPAGQPRLPLVWTLLADKSD